MLADADDEALAQLESTLLRAAARSRHELAMARHALIARPLWEEGRIIHAIWDDLCRASVVLVELGDANLNVMIELGMAHAIGRPVLAVLRRDPASAKVDVRPRHIEKLRMFPYRSPAELKEVLLAKLTA